MFLKIKFIQWIMMARIGCGDYDLELLFE